MRLLTFQSPAGPRLGIQTTRGVVDVVVAREQLFAHSTEFVPDTIEEVFATGERGLAALRHLLKVVEAQEQLGTWLLAEESLQYGLCVPHTGKIICVGLNYRRHAAESGMAVPESPVLFPKYANSFAASGEEVPLPGNAVQYDYEAELAVVIGRQTRFVGVEEALSSVLGYCNANDLSARELQFRTSQWLLGKALDKFLPVGPYLVTADEVGDPQRLGIRCWLNGELCQDSTTADMIFPVAYIISYLSQYLTLEPGDVISTGTPEGVLMGKQDPQWLKPGDEVIVEIETLGRLVNSMR
ncbi:hypothetical protein KSD_92030 [Ktedonobacter sp. SOSP1-85]|uniref:fumarylacetoacetate hydrolase family protein n=1 Tax=Ktedonobacter sp. SOSP1-85 TaxID=2778367 RepID=UPI001916ABA4|nr:fumarylacetoacetate hydrolase family protein [Ktedonobacter sp. SOSP1-85]GHO81432.1 hypothetical protein KSD_92030 [Ktedonobacter sp. SOSP1-85]